MSLLRFVRPISGCGVWWEAILALCGLRSRTVCLCQGPRIKAFILRISITIALTEILLPAPLPEHCPELSLFLSDALKGFSAAERSLQLKSYMSVWKRSGLKQGWRNSDRQTSQESSTRTVFSPKSLTDFFLLEHWMMFLLAVLCVFYIWSPATLNGGLGATLNTIPRKTVPVNSKLNLW